MPSWHLRCPHSLLSLSLFTAISFFVPETVVLSVQPSPHRLHCSASLVAFILLLRRLPRSPAVLFIFAVSYVSSNLSCHCLPVSFVASNGKLLSEYTHLKTNFAISTSTQRQIGVIKGRFPKGSATLGSNTRQTQTPTSRYLSHTGRHQGTAHTRDSQEKTNLQFISIFGKNKKARRGKKKSQVSHRPTAVGS